MWVDSNTRDDKGRTVLHIAAVQGRSDLVKSILDEGRYDVMVLDLNGNSPLHYSGHVDTIRCLVEYGAELFARNKHGDTPLDLMKRRGVQKEAIEAMEELIIAAKHGLNGNPCLRTQPCLRTTLSEQSILAEFCSDVGLKRLAVIITIILCLSFYIAYKATGMSKPTDHQVLVDHEVNRFEL